jgi:hypothetical protein
VQRSRAAFGFTECVFEGTEAIFTGDAALGKQFDPPLKILLAFEQSGDVVLESVKLTLEIHPTPEDQRHEHHQLEQNRQVEPAVQTPGGCSGFTHDTFLKNKRLQAARQDDEHVAQVRRLPQTNRSRYGAA